MCNTLCNLVSDTYRFRTSFRALCLSELNRPDYTCISPRSSCAVILRFAYLLTPRHSNVRTLFALVRYLWNNIRLINNAWAVPPPLPSLWSDLDILLTRKSFTFIHFNPLFLRRGNYVLHSHTVR